MLPVLGLCWLAAAAPAQEVSTNLVEGQIGTDTVWAATDGVYRLTGDVTVTAAVTLTIRPGVEVYFDPDIELVVSGRLLAEGTPEQPIRLSPSAPALPWRRISLEPSPTTSRLAWVIVDGAQSPGTVTARGTAVELDHVTFTNTQVQLLTFDDTSALIRGCVFPAVANDEPIHYAGIPPDGQARIEGCVFQAASGYNDIVDFTGGRRPGPIVQFLDNLILGSGDDGFDIDGGDAHIEGNVFVNVRQDAERSSSANAIATGLADGHSPQIVVVRNLFVNCDHSLLLKEHAAALFENNTVFRVAPNPLSSQPPAVINFAEANRNLPGGAGAIFRANLVWDLQAEVFTHFTNDLMFLEVSHSLIEGTNWPGLGNVSADPRFVNPEDLTPENIRSNLALLPDSPAVGMGPNGLDLGAQVPGGATIAGVPPTVTTNTTATLTIGGPGIYAYRWNLNDGPWSVEIPLTNSLAIGPTLFADAPPLELSGLASGTYTVAVIGKNSAGVWQDPSTPTLSPPWTVTNPALTTVSGVLSSNTVWGPSLGEIHVADDFVVPDGLELALQPGTIIRVAPGVSIETQNGRIEVTGTATEPVRFVAMDPNLPWGPLAANGANAVLNLHHADISGGYLDALEGATVLVEESVLHDFQNGSRPIVHALDAGSLVLRRCHLHHYFEILSQRTPTLIEDCLLEHILGDGIDYDAAPPGSAVRDCTIRHGAGTNIDGVDLGSYGPTGAPSRDTLVERCLIYDFPFDKGVSIGEGAINILVRDCVIYDVDIGIAVKDSSEARLEHNTLVDSNYGIRLYEKVAGRGGGHALAVGNIAWGNHTRAIEVDALSTLTVEYSDVEGTPVFPGPHNLNVDPLFRDPARHDYRLRPDSPLHGVGPNETDPGARYPVGSSRVDTDADGLPDPWELEHDLDPFTATDAEQDPDGDTLSNQQEYLCGTDPNDSASTLKLEVVSRPPNAITFEFDAAAGRSYALERSHQLSPATWQTVTNHPTLGSPGRVRLTDLPPTREPASFYRLRLPGSAAAP